MKSLPSTQLCAQHKQTGIVLLTTIMFLSVFTLLIISGLQTFLLYYKNLNQFIANNDDLYQLEYIAQKLAQTTAEIGRPCVISEHDPNAILDALEQAGCKLTYNNTTYFYLMELLGSYPCLQTTIKQVQFSTKHVRITVLEKTDKNNTGQSVLQLRFAQSIPLEVCKDNNVIRIHTGLLSWRYLPNFHH